MSHIALILFYISYVGSSEGKNKQKGKNSTLLWKYLLLCVNAFSLLLPQF